MTNEEFYKLSKPEQRVLIAQDAINQVIANQFTPMQNVYARFEFSDISKVKQSTSLQPFVKDEQIPCEVCGVGGLIISMIRLANHVKFNYQAQHGDWYYKNISQNSCMLQPDSVPIYKYFTKRQLAMIETAFELEPRDCNDELEYELEYGLDDDIIDKCKEFGRNYENLSDRFIAIMENIVKNKGMFKP